jgi:hypothetical protein
MSDYHWTGLETRTRHLYIPGMAGTGKTSLMTNLILSDLEFECGPLIVIDPKGSDQGLVNRVLPYIPKGLVKNTFLLTLTNPVPLDLLGYKDEFDKDFVRGDVIDILKRFSYGSWGPTMQGTLNHLIPTLLEAPDATFLDIGRFLESEKRRDEILSQVSKERRAYWKENPPSKSDIGPISTRMSNFYNGPLSVICGGRRGEGLNIEEIIENNQILLVDTYPKSDNGAMLGALVMARIQQAIFKRKSGRPYEVCNVYADEFHNFVNSRLTEILLEARSFKLSLCMANPTPRRLADIWDDMRAAVSSYVIFRLDGEDAQMFKGRFHPTSQSPTGIDHLRLNFSREVAHYSQDPKHLRDYDNLRHEMAEKRKPRSLADDISALPDGYAIFVNTRTGETALIRTPRHPAPSPHDYTRDIIENTYAQVRKKSAVDSYPCHTAEERHTEGNEQDFAVPEGTIKKGRARGPQ